MRVRITKEAKKYLTVAEMPFVNKIISEMKGDETQIEEYCQMAMKAIAPDVNTTWKILDVSAEICKDCKTPYDYFGEEAGTLNVWIKFIAFSSYDGCYEVGCLLSDIFNMAYDKPETYENLKNHAYINAFTKG